jgi:Protein of unknown function (DUF3015)
MKNASKIAVGVMAGLAALAMAPTAMAAPYGTAGCGLGSIVFKDKPGFIQVVAATLNGTSGNQTFAISTGTSGCGKTEPAPAAAAAFIETNREAFAKDAARGQGETISSLTTLAGCQDASAVGTVLQGEFSKIFTGAQAADTAVSKGALDALKAHPELGCAKLI